MSGEKNSSLAARLCGVSKRYGDARMGFLALQDIDLDVRSDEFTLLMGPSGSGKTTLISILGCLIRPTAGQVEIGGLRVDHLCERELPRIRRQSIGFIFQSFNLLGSLSAIENVEVPLRMANVQRKAAREKARSLLDCMHLGGMERRLPADLSGGEQQRVAIARAMALDPQMVLADEPTAALDSKTGREVMGILAAYAHAGHAVMVVTHDVRLEDLADRIFQLEDGKLKG